MKQMHILIVEDEPSVARGVRYSLEKEGYRVSWASTGVQAQEMACSEKPDLFLLDIRLPDISGFDVCKQLRAAGNLRPVLMLTARDEELDRVLGLELGADDYIIKPFSVRELLSRVRAHLRRAYGEYAHPTIPERLEFGSVEVDSERMQVKKAGQVVYLTPTELRLLQHLLRNPNHAYNRETLLETVWGYDSEVLNERTVDVHIHNLREKLEDDPQRPRWLVTVRGAGYMFAS